MKQLNCYKWIVITGCIAVCLMGFSYASYTDNLSIMQNITTAKMDYTFDSGGKLLNLTFDPETSLLLLNLKKDESYKVSYSISKEDFNNIPLKGLMNEYIGNIDIKLNSVVCTQNDIIIDPSADILALVPNSLGNFDCYHDFDGINGTITLVKKTEPFVVKSSINKNELSEEEQEQLGIATSNESTMIVENQEGQEMIKENDAQQKNSSDEESINKEEGSINKEEVSINKEEVSINKEEESINNVEESINNVEESIESTTVSIEAKYGFDMPLSYDQYNAMAK